MHPQSLPHFTERIPYDLGAVDLRAITTDDEHNASGSYAYPPAPRNARQAIAFWLSCEVPDGVMRAVGAAHTRLMRDRQEEANDVLARSALLPRARERRASAESLLDRVRFIDRRNLRSVIRVAKLCEYAADLPEGEPEKVYACVFVLDTGEALTPVDLVEIYDLTAVWSAFEDNRERRDQAQYEAIVETRNIWARSVSSSSPLRPY
ncbi:MAG: hypothetical protein J2P58_13005 [Acidimicrobiaceae bacterium]|nr:hypothetical protein [Acidimicrobiaceae bacterium]